MMNTITLILASLLYVANGLPIDSCSSQSECLSTNVGSCDGDGNRQVCLRWVPGANCVKSSDSNTLETVSHSCPGLGGTKDYNNDGSESWSANDDICVTVRGGEDAVFGVKDGRGCSDPGAYYVDGFVEPITCTGPQNVCDGRNNKECLWTVPTETCGGGFVCPSELVCEVFVQCSNVNSCSTVTYPCTGLHEGNICPCTEYRLVR